MGKLIFETKKIDRDTTEIEFKERFEAVSEEKGNKLLLRERSEWKSDGDLFYKELPEKNLPEILCAALIENGIDAYTYSDHPLVKGRSLCITSQNPAKDLNRAVDKVKGDLNEMQTLFEKKLK